MRKKQRKIISKEEHDVLQRKKFASPFFKQKVKRMTEMVNIFNLTKCKRLKKSEIKGIVHYFADTIDVSANRVATSDSDKDGKDDSKHRKSIKY